MEIESVYNFVGAVLTRVRKDLVQLEPGNEDFDSARDFLRGNMFSLVVGVASPRLDPDVAARRIIDLANQVRIKKGKCPIVFA